MMALADVPSAMAQLDTATGPATHLMKHALFVSPDTSYEMTYVLAEESGLTFYRERYYPENFRWQGMADHRQTSDTTWHTQILRAELLPGIDTLRSFFPSTKYGPPITETVGNERVGYTSFTEDELTADAFLAFALRAFGLPTFDTATAYYFGQVDHTLTPIGKRYVLCEVEGWKSGTPLFRYTVGRIAPQGFEVVERDTLLVPPKEMHRLRRMLYEFVGAEWGSCVDGAQASSHMLIVGENKVVRAEHCRDWKRRRRPDALIRIHWIYWKYSRTNRPTPKS
jgi:hypothetical protein